MRLMLLPLALIVSAPAFAQEGPEPADRAPDRGSMTARQLGDTLSDPKVQDSVAAMVGLFAGIIMDTPVGPMARYAGRDSGIRPGDRLGDVVRRDDPDFDRRLQRNTRRAVAATGQAARDGAEMAQGIQDTAQRLKKLLEVTAATARSYRRGE